jgi:plasmid maintenance system killer protein
MHFFTTGSTAGINPNHAARLEERLQALNTSMSNQRYGHPWMEIASA